MRINILGGGPAGLYSAILLKKLDETADVHVFEKNASGSTFGWGVVFSAETLGNLRDADEPTFLAIEKNFAYWDDIELFHEVRRERSTGHGFCGIGRQRLLLLLEERAKNLGVEIHFETPVTDLDAHLGADLLIGAGGLGSITRKRFESDFGVSITEGKSRFVWLGSDWKLDAFTFIFRQSEHGVFQVHAYQFDNTTSTFIVECDEETFQRAGLSDDMDIAGYFEALFAPELKGAKLFAKDARWRRFPTIECERWTQDNVVLVGDAAHTAHFSVGSGTKLAMEDAIALVDALEKSRALGATSSKETIKNGLSLYEETRRVPVLKTQKAAAQSRRWFEDTERHMRLTTEQLYFSLLSRTRRITYDNLKLRDADYVERSTGYFHDQLRTQDDAEQSAVPPMFTRFVVGSGPGAMTLANRIVVSPMCQYKAADGLVNDWHLVHLGSRAVGGAGLIIAEMTNVSADGRITPGCAGLYRDEHAIAWKRVTDFVHSESEAKIAVQLAHAGRKGSCAIPWKAGSDVPLAEGERWETLGPSPIAWNAGHPTPRQMNAADMKRVTSDFVAAAKRAKDAGFDIVELHLAHGYLLSSFISPVSNQRTDEYGGSPERRARFPLEVVRAVREAWEGPLFARISATDWLDHDSAVESFSEGDAVELAKWLKAAGVDLIDVSAGQTSPDQKPVYGRAFQTPFSEYIRNEVGIPTITVGNILDGDRANTILLAGRADLVAMARAHLADPYLTHHAAAAQGLLPKWPLPYKAAQTVAPKLFGPESD